MFLYANPGNIYHCILCAVPLSFLNPQKKLIISGFLICGNLKERFFILMEIWAVAKGTRRENLEFSLSWYFSLIFSLSTYLKHYENTIEPFLCCLLIEMSLSSLQTVNVTKMEKVRNYMQGSGVLGSYSSLDQGPLDESSI